MPKISEYDDLGTPQGEEQFVVARGGTTKNLLWDTIKAYLQTKYLGYGLGVSTGDSHAHISGRGAQIDHTGLSNIGTNTHAQIDSFIMGGGAYWNTLIKTADQSFSYTYKEIDYDLFFFCKGNVTYAYRARIWFTAPAAQDFECWFVESTSVSKIEKVTVYPVGSTTPTVYIGASVAAYANGGVGVGYLEFDGTVKFLTTSDYWNRLAFAFGPYTTDGAVTVYAGSYVEYKEIS